jgi:hydroxymethylpyrimidine/phosphomethylpyrimidine kinase
LVYRENAIFSYYFLYLFAIKRLNSKIMIVNRPVVLSIAGFDPSSGAGITADIKTIAAHECYGVTCVTALTVQSTQGVKRVDPVSGELVHQTLDYLAQDFEFAAVKIGMLGSAEVVAAVAEFLRRQRPPNVVVDPVLRSSSGASLLDGAGSRLLAQEILPLATVTTPNLDEARVLARLLGESDRQASDTMENGDWVIAERICQSGVRNVVITGGHQSPPTDLLVSSAGRMEFLGDWINSQSTHGTGCAFSSSVACNLAVGLPIEESVRRAKHYVAQALLNAYPAGKGVGSLNHFPAGWSKRKP